MVGAVRIDGRRANGSNGTAGAVADRNGRSSFRDLAVCKHRHGVVSAATHRERLARRNVAACQRDLVQWSHGAGRPVWRPIHRSPAARAGTECFHQLLSMPRWRSLILTILNEERQWPIFTKVLRREDLKNDPRL